MLLLAHRRWRRWKPALLLLPSTSGTRRPAPPFVPFPRGAEGHDVNGAEELHHLKRLLSPPSVERGAGSLGVDVVREGVKG
jgi:hypothetical protein